MSRRKRKGAEQDVSAYRQSMVQVRIGKRNYDAVYQPSCKTCTHPARMLIEEKILQNYSFRAIAELFSEKEIPGEDGRPMMLPKISRTSVHNHFQSGHMPLEAATLRRLAEKRAATIGSRYEEQADQFVDHVVLAEATITRVYERMVKGEIQPEVKDGIAAAKLVADIEAETQAGVTNEAWSDAMEIYFDVVMGAVDEETWFKIAAKLRTNPILRALERKMNPDNVIDAEPVAAIGGPAA